MTYFEALGATQASDWNSTKYRGVCKPTTFQALDVARRLQMELNRVAQALGLKKITVDGDIGPGTLNLLKAIQAKGPTVSGGLAVAPATSCTAVALMADGLTASAKAVADSRGVATKVDQPVPTKPVTIVTPSGQEVAAPPSLQTSYSSAIDFGGNDKMILPALLVLGGAIWLYTKDKKKGTSVTFSTRRTSVTHRARRRRR